MLSHNYENINNVMTQILKLSCVSFSYVNISYVLAFSLGKYLGKKHRVRKISVFVHCSVSECLANQQTNV